MVCEYTVECTLGVHCVNSIKNFEGYKHEESSSMLILAKAFAIAG